MRIGVPTEVKNNEFRVAATPAMVHLLTQHGHTVQVQRGAGLGSAFPDEEYARAGAQLVDTAQEVWDNADMIVKVKEPIEQEYELMHEGLFLFTYLHLAADRTLTEQLVQRKVDSIAYETVQKADHSLPLLAPMSEIAGRLAPQVGANALMKFQGGSGTLLGGASGVHPADVVVLGGGVAGLNAARVANGMGARVTVFDINTHRMQYIEEVSNGQIQTTYSSPLEIELAVQQADMVIGSVLIPGAKTPHLVSNDLVSRMRPGSVLVDIAIDQGGCFEDSHPTTHAEPTFMVHNSVFYCVANMPGAVPHTSTIALTNATMTYAAHIADVGWKEATVRYPELIQGITTHAGTLFTPAVGEALGMPASAPEEALRA